MALGSLVVETVRVLVAAAVVGLVTPLKAMRTVRPAGMLALVSSAHWIVRPLGLKQKPMSWPVVVSTTVSLARPLKGVPGGKMAAMRLLAAALSAPLAESVNCTR